MAQHVGMGGQGQPGEFSIVAHGRPDGLAGQRGAALADEEGLPRRSHRRPLLEPGFDGAQLVPPQGMRGGQPPLEAGDVQHPAFDIDLREFQPAGFRNPQAVAEQEQQQAAVAGRVPRPLDGVHETVHFAGGQVFALVHRFVSSRGSGTRENSRACGGPARRL